jgi:hypothetical protein
MGSVECKDSLMTNSGTLYCYIHPNRPTVLRCNRCERPICTEDAIRTPTGYRCPKCIRVQQKAFDTAQWRDYIVAFVVAAVCSAVASGLVLLISGFFFGLGVLLLAPAAGALIGNVVLRATGRRRSRALFATASAGVIAGALPALLLVTLPALLAVLAGGFGGLGALLPAIWQIAYLFMAVPASYTQISGIRLTR